MPVVAALPEGDALGQHRQEERLADKLCTTDLLAGTTVRVHHRTREEDDPRDYDAQVLGVDAQGMLRVRAPGGEERLLSGEEVSISPKGV